MNEITSSFEVSPFDAIKQTRTDGSEFWSARDLMETMGYAYWKNFETPLNRAMMTSRNQGQVVEVLFTRSGKKSIIGRPKEDYELSRYAAYLVAMNGDPNMPNVAAAQSYFAIQTRVAETQKPALDIAELASNPDLLIQLATNLKEERAGRELAEAKVNELEPAATAYNHWKPADKGMSRRELCQKLRSEYPGMNEARLREHMQKRRDLVKKMRANGEYDLVPASAMYDKGFAVRYTFKDKGGAPRIGFGWTFAYYEELVKRFSKTLAPAGQQEVLEVGA